MESKIIVTTYTFRKPLELIWKIIKDTRLINQLPETFNKKINQEPIFLNGNTSYEPGALFYYHLMKEQDLYFAVEDCYETDYSSKIEWKVSHNNDSDYLFIQTIVLTYISEYTTLLTCKYSFNMNSKVVKEQFVESEAIMKRYYYNIEKGINVKKYQMTNIAGIKIKANISEIKQFVETPQIFFGIKGKLIRMTNKEMKKGTIFIAKIDVNGNLFKKYKNEYEINAVIRKISSHKESYAIHLLISNNTNAILPNRELIVQICYINDNESYVVMRHNFWCEIGEKVNTFLNEYKAKLLSKLKHLIEKMLMQSVSL